MSRMFKYLHVIALAGLLVGPASFLPRLSAHSATLTADTPARPSLPTVPSGILLCCSQWAP